jgi:PD-(D/E)XK nuclease superfamily protein
MPPYFRQPKRRGEWAELKFLLRATEAGILVSKPYGDSARFDFILGHRSPLHRVQVRSTRILTNSDAYICRLTWGNPPVRYARNDFDFLAALVVPCDAWYIVPIAAILGRRHASFYPHHPNTHSRMEPYREAWHLLSRPPPIGVPRRGAVT